MNTNYETKIRCGDKCSNECEIVDLIVNAAIVGYVGNKCEQCVAKGAKINKVA